MVTITAVDGDLAIREGPDMVFDAIAVLEEGVKVQAQARSVLEGWLQIPIPSRPGETGWVSIQTRFSVVQGQVLDLPKIMTVEWPFGSYLRNCTSHRMVVEPGGTLLPPVAEAPDNRVWLFPALYHIYDLDIAGRPEVTGIQLREHTEVDIVEDGADQRGVCP